MVLRDRPHESDKMEFCRYSVVTSSRQGSTQLTSAAHLDAHGAGASTKATDVAATRISPTPSGTATAAATTGATTAIVCPGC
mmetsp:Transcript_24881/g.36510  ORF Transcript_24881/g.36510 Transcript_24881/m.36510 type:complete len:82 (+) Transcript_24881:388-633(+)